MHLPLRNLICLAALAFVTSCGKKEEAATGEVGKFESPWACEEHWMVSNVVRDLQSMAGLTGGKLADGPAMPDAAAHEYHVGKTKLAMAPSCWDIASYQPLLESWKPTPQVSVDSGPDLIHDLLTPTATGLQKANDAVSNRIKAAPADPLVHEEAAFLLGVLGIRENAREFSDLRPLLCRMTAHLAAANHLRGGAEISPVGQWAQVVHHLHAGRPRVARDLMGRIPDEGDAGRWKRAVELLITGDWRRTQDLADPSLTEAIAHARALKEARGNAMMMEFVGQRKDLQAIPEWSRLLAGRNKSVEEGHLAMKSAVPMEFYEASEIFRLGKSPTPEKLAKFISTENSAGLVGKDGAPRVISDGDWAAYFRRHFFVCCADISRFAAVQWSSHEAAVEWEKSVLPYTRKLPGFELLEPLVSTGVSDYQSDMVATAAFIRHHPEQTPAALWYDYRFPAMKVRSEASLPQQSPWFREVSPPGTAHDPIRRIRFEGIQDGTWVDHMKALHEIDPWNPTLCYEVAENTGNNIESVKNAWGEIREYSTVPLSQTLEGSNLTSDQRIDTLKTFSKYDPEQGLALGAALVMAGRPEEAIAAYELAYKDAPDRVAVSNQSLWMIHYYKSKGQDAKAREIADHNAEVYSASGLLSAMLLAIVEKDSARANNYAEAMNERYGTSCYLPAAAWGAKGDEKALRSVFPAGLQETTLPDVEARNPVKGARINENSATVRAVGLRAGDIVMAVDGKRVENFAQYLVLMSVTLDPRTRIIYRRGKKFAEIDCLLPLRRLDAGMVDFGN